MKKQKQEEVEKGIVLQREFSIVNERIKKMFNQKTPKKYIKKREGRGGFKFDYVEVGYVIKKLNEMFGPFWKFEIKDKGREGKQIWVLGKLTIYFAKDFFISKEQYGSATVKITREGKVVNLGDDYKAAASDALKKCASMFGIAHDVYFQEAAEVEEEKSDEEELLGEFATKEGATSKKCPKCGSVMYLRTVKKEGKNKGRKFWSCSNEDCGYFEWA